MKIVSVSDVMTVNTIISYEIITKIGGGGGYNRAISQKIQVTHGIFHSLPLESVA